MGLLILILFFMIVMAIVSTAWWIIGAIMLVLFLWVRYRNNQRLGANRRAYTLDERLHNAGLARRIARTQRDLARSDAKLGLGSAYLSAVNADKLERLAKTGAKVN